MVVQVKESNQIDVLLCDAKKMTKRCIALELAADQASHHCGLQCDAVQSPGLGHAAEEHARRPRRRRRGRRHLRPRVLPFPLSPRLASWAHLRCRARGKVPPQTILADLAWREPSLAEFRKLGEEFKDSWGFPILPLATFDAN